VLYTPEKIQRTTGFLRSNLLISRPWPATRRTNIKGVRGIGKVGAEKLLKQYKSIDGIYKNLENWSLGKSKSGLRAGEKDAHASRELVVLKKDVPVKFNPEETKFGKQDAEAVNNFFIEYGFRSLMEKEASGAKHQASGKEREINTLNEAKKVLGRIKDELLFYIIESPESLFGKEIREIYIASGGGTSKIIFGKNLKAPRIFSRGKIYF